MKERGVSHPVTESEPPRPLLFTFFFVNLPAWRRSMPEEPGEIDQVDRSILVETGA